VVQPEEAAEQEQALEQVQVQVQAQALEQARELMALAKSSLTRGSFDSRYHRNP
jgi:hypothetical protein